MKRKIAYFLAIMMILSCCACGKDKTPASSGSQNNSGTTQSDAVDGTSDVTDSSGDNADNSSQTDDSSQLENLNGGSNEESQTQNGSNDGNTSSNGSVTKGTLTVTDSPVYENYITIDDSVSYPDTFVEYKSTPSTLDTAWNMDVTAKIGNSDEQADAIRNKVLNAKNTLQNYKIKGTVYYVSPNGNDDNDGKSPTTAFKSMKAPIFSMNVLKPGDAVLFERGGLWRLTSAIKCKEGITYGSYGTGEKPTFYGSPYNYANKDYWHPSNRANVWKIAVADTDIGLVVFNHGEIVGIKKLNGIITLEKNGDYYFNKNQDTLYVYCDKGNPGKVFKDIEIGLNKAVFSASNTDDITFDNLRIKYSGRFGFDVCGCDNFNVTNCEIGFIGGAIQSGSTRLGNGIQVWNGVTNHTVENCWIYQIYDAGVTFQGNDTYAASYMSDEYKNVTYKNNLFEYCTYSVEFWHGNSEPSVSYAKIENFNMTGNVSRFAGFGWGRQRSDHTGNHIAVFERSFPNAKGNKISDNIFDLADSFVVKWAFRSGANNGEWDISGNTYYHGYNRFNQSVWFGSMEYASNYSELLKTINYFEKSPKSVVWVGDVK